MSRLFRDKLFRYQLFALLAGLLLMMMKFGAYFITNSNTILTDALESIVNIIAGAVALYSIVLSSKPRDADHPYGHGKVEFLSAGLEGILIMIAGLLIIWKSAFNFVHLHPVEQIEWGLLIMVISGMANWLIGAFLLKKGREAKSLILEADGKHLMVDAYLSAAVVLGLLVIRFVKFPYLDNIIAILLGLYIVYSGYKLVRRSLSGIMDEADEEVIDGVINYLRNERKESWIDIHNLRVIQYGAHLHIDCHVTLPYYLSLEESHAEVQAVEKAVNSRHNREVELFIHADPCVERSCAICQIADCKVRKFAFEKKVEWTLDNLWQNKKHSAETL